MLKTTRAISTFNRLTKREITLRVNYSGLGPQADEPFWRFIGCALVSRPEILSKQPDLSDLEIAFSLNGESADLLRAWKLFSDFKPALESTVKTVVDGVPNEGTTAPQSVRREQMIDMVQELRSQFLSRIESLESQYSRAVDEVACAASSIASDYAAESVRDHASEHEPHWEGARDDFSETCDDILSRLRSES